jgi:hypothetical protein
MYSWTRSNFPSRMWKLHRRHQSKDESAVAQVLHHLPPKLDPLLGLHFRNVLGDAVRAERGVARRLSHVT